MSVIDRKEMGKRIRNKREKMKLTQEKLAEKVNSSTSHIGEIERGDGNCSLDLLVRLATVLDLSLDFLVRGITNKNVDLILSKKLEGVPIDKKEMCLNLCESFVDYILK